jgi:peptidoglycan hydrolase CwlO-like protein
VIYKYIVGISLFLVTFASTTFLYHELQVRNKQIKDLKEHVEKLDSMLTIINEYMAKVDDSKEKYEDRRKKINETDTEDGFIYFDDIDTE